MLHKPQNRARALELFANDVREGGCCSKCQEQEHEYMEPDATHGWCEHCESHNVMALEEYYLKYLPY